MKNIYIVNTTGGGEIDIIIGIFEDLTEAKKCAEAMSIIKEQEWSNSNLYFDVRRTVLKGDKPWKDRYLTTACWQDEAGGCRGRKTLYYISRKQLNHCILESEEYKNIVKGL